MGWEVQAVDMFRKILAPLDGSNVAEQVLPYVRVLAGGLEVPVELLGVVDLDIEQLTPQLPAEKRRHLDAIIEESSCRTELYLKEIAQTFPGAKVSFAVEKGRAAEMIIARAATDKDTLIAMATHGRSGVDRWLLGSVAEKVLRGSANPLLLVRAKADAKAEGELTLKSIVVPLDGSAVAESVLPTVLEVAKKLNMEIVLCRAFIVPYSPFGGIREHFTIVDELLGGIKAEAHDYLEKKAEELKKQGAHKVSCVLKQGAGADQIISLGRATPDNLIAMCTHGWSGPKGWVLGSVTETVVRHSGDPVLVIRAA
jgi:nucleotide-binding universal stress UspA family protein